MRPLHALTAGALALAAAASQAHDIVAEGTPLLRELADPKYGHSRCLLPPVLAADGRTVVGSPDPSFKPGDTVLAVDDEVLDDASRSGVIDILERRPAGGRVRVRLSANGVERVVDAGCGDAKPYYDELREAARAAAANDASVCARRADAAQRLHGLSSIWLRLSMSCRIEAGTLTGAAMWRADYDLFRQRIEEARSTAPLLKSLRHPVSGAARDLSEHGYPGLGDRLRRDYAAAYAALGEAAHDED